MIKKIMLVFCFMLLMGTLTFGQITFSGNWENGITGKGNWYLTQQMDSSSLQLVTSPVRQGQYAVRIEVGPGDDPLGSSGERAEVAIMTDSKGAAISENESSGTQYYAFSVRLDPNWVAPEAGSSGNWAIIFQLHGPNALHLSPSIALDVLDELKITLHSGNLDSPSESLRWQKYPFTDGSLNLGHWIDIVLEIKFSKDFDGSVKAWRRNEGQTEFIQVLSLNDVPTLQYKASVGPVADHYWKHGYYRSKQTSVNNILWLDGMVRGNTYADVVWAAFGTPTGVRTNLNEPKDLIKVHPNPINTNFNLIISPETLLDDARMKIYDLSGNEIKNVSIKSHKTVIERSGLKSGFYFYHIFNNNETIGNGKLVVQ